MTIAALLVLGTVSAPAASEACEVIPPIRAVNATPMYSDPKGSITDEAKAAVSRQQLAGLEAFFRAEEAPLDAPTDKAALDCAFQNLQRWAEEGAMTETASNEGAIQRLEYLVGLEVIALKFKAKGYTLTPTMLKWMSGINAQVMGNYIRNRKPEIRGNLYFWSGVDAALSALLSPDAAALDYQNTVWHDAMEDIRPDGTLDREMMRGQRALIYHQYAFSALMVLRAARQALHLPTSPMETQKLKRLGDTIGETICHPEAMAQRAGAPKMEMPGEWAYRVNIVFGADLLSDGWKRCGLHPNKPTDVRLGGLSANSVAAIAAAHR